MILTQRQVLSDWSYQIGSFKVRGIGSRAKDDSDGTVRSFVGARDESARRVIQDGVDLLHCEKNHVFIQNWRVIFRIFPFLIKWAIPGLIFALFSSFQYSLYSFML